MKGTMPGILALPSHPEKSCALFPSYSTLGGTSAPGNPVGGLGGGWRQEATSRTSRLLDIQLPVMLLQSHVLDIVNGENKTAYALRKQGRKDGAVRTRKNKTWVPAKEYRGAKYHDCDAG